MDQFERGVRSLHQRQDAVNDQSLCLDGSSLLDAIQYCTSGLLYNGSNSAKAKQENANVVASQQGWSYELIRGTLRFEWLSINISLLRDDRRNH